MYLQLLQQASSDLDVRKPAAQAVLSISTQNNNIPGFWIPPTIYNLNISSQPSNHQEMNDGFQDRRRMRGDSSEDLQHYQDGSIRGNLNHSRHSQLLLTAPIGQIDGYDRHMDDSSMSPAKRAKHRHQQIGGQAIPPSTNSANAPLTSQEASLTQPSLPNSPFVFFFRIERENLLEKAKKGDTQFQNTQEVVDSIEKKWEYLPVEERRIYQQLAAKDEVRYKREMEEYQLRQLQEQRRISNQTERLATSNLQNMLFPGASASTSALHVDPRIQQVNVIAGIRPPLPTSVVAAPTPVTTTTNTVTNVAPSHHPVIPSTQTTTVGASNVMYPSPNRNMITPQENASGMGGQPLSPNLPLHQRSPGNPSPPALTNSSSGTIVLPPSQSLPLPAGMEIELGGRKYTVGYECQFMSREEAQKYVKPYTAAQNETSETQQERASPSSQLIDSVGERSRTARS